MDSSRIKTTGEVHLKNLFQKVYNRKFYFLASIFFCLALGYLYTKIAVPKYEVSTSILIDPSGKNRQLSESKYIDGGIGLIEAEKNLFNEIAILKSYTLIEQALKEVDFSISYFLETPWNKKEIHKSAPFEIKFKKDKPQIYGAPFKVEFLGKDKYRLSIATKKFTVGNANTNSGKEIKEDFEFSNTFSIGDTVAHEYFNFSIQLSENNPISDFKSRSFQFQFNTATGLANDYHERLKVEQVDIQASIFTLGLTGASSQKEIEFLRALSNTFISRKLLERDEIAANKESFIQDQLQSFSDSLARAEKSLENFKRGANAVDLSRTTSNTLDQLQKLEGDQGQIRLNIKYYQSLLDYINDTDAIDKIVAPSVAGINDPLLSENLLELKKLHAEKTRLEFLKGAKSYDLVLLNDQVANTTNSLKENVRNLIRTENLKLTDRNSRIARLEATISQLPASEKKLVNFERENTLYTRMYNYLNEELAKIGIARAEDISDTKVIDLPRQIGDGPVAPQKLLIMLLAGIVGILIPVTGIVFANSKLEKIQSPGQIESHVDIPLIGQIPVFNTALSTLANYKSDRGKEEAFRSLSANLRFLVPDPDKNVIAISSYSKGDGKSFCALNLAAGFAKSGKKTLLIDLNFRNPVLSRGLDVQNTPDLKSYILDSSYSIEKVTQKHPAIVNLSYIITKTSEPNPHLFLSSSRMNTLVSALKFEYDYIIFDTPATGLVSDYLLISKYTDINLFVLSKGQAQVLHLDEFTQLISTGALQDSFFIFNRSTEKIKSKSGYTIDEENAGRKQLVKWPRFKRSVS